LTGVSVTTSHKTGIFFYYLKQKECWIFRECSLFKLTAYALSENLGCYSLARKRYKRILRKAFAITLVWLWELAKQIRSRDLSYFSKTYFHCCALHGLWLLWQSIKKLTSSCKLSLSVRLFLTVCFNFSNKVSMLRLDLLASKTSLRTCISKWKWIVRWDCVILRSCIYIRKLVVN
jgi:hypothetical protein